MGIIRGNFTKDITNGERERERERDSENDIKRRGGITAENMGEMKKY